MDIDGHGVPRGYYNSFDYSVAGHVSAGTAAVLQLIGANGRFPSGLPAAGRGGSMSERERIRLTSMVACAG
jgi:hypothetical protein